MGRFAALATVLCALLGACTTATHEKNYVTVGPGALQGGDKDRGEKIFAANCASCHGRQGAGGTIGPSLRDESWRLDYDALTSWIEDPEPPMPRLYPSVLSKAQVRDVAAYVLTL